jgi:demethoxyubiquinone hydroxylase (CLK1/Coq7/Cat5 family)
LERQGEDEMTSENQQTVDTLNSLLRGEISAVETYRQAMEKLNHSASRTQLSDCHLSHEQRVAKLRAQVERLGGQPSAESGPWGMFARLVEGGAKAFGEKAAISALEEGEDHGLKLYRDEISKLDPESRRLVEIDLLPAQERTHQTLSSIKHAMH